MLCLAIRDEMEAWIEEEHGDRAKLVSFASWARRDAVTDWVERWGEGGDVVAVLDEIFVEDGLLTRRTNRAGGLEGGISTGQPIVLHAAMKPISTLGRPLASVDVRSKRVARAAYERSDICAVAAVSVIVENVVAFEIARAIEQPLQPDRESIQPLGPRSWRILRYESAVENHMRRANGSGSRRSRSRTR